MNFDPFDHERRFREMWEAVRIERPVRYSLFTFGESVLPYYLVLGVPRGRDAVSVTRGEVRITRPRIITPGHDHPEFHNFFENDEDEDGIIQFLLARTAAFSNLQFDNASGPAQVVSDNVEEAVAKLNRRLDDEDEDHTAILSAPPPLGKIAILRYATERVVASGPDNVQELRERGFLP
ncbi:MAG: hypothetical protein WD066_05960 [Planctomycetaceae bacterium]